MIQAMLFDLDGTLVNSDPLHYQAWRGTLAHYGLEIDEAFYATRISGRLNAKSYLICCLTYPPRASSGLSSKKNRFTGG